MSVCFCSQDKVHTFDKADGEERPQLWWTPSDYLRFRAHNTKTTLVLRNKQAHCLSEDLSTFCHRGLESFGGVESRERLSRIRETISFVIKMQESDAEEDVALQYEQHSAESKVHAQSLGMRDEEDVLREYIEEHTGDGEGDTATRESLKEVLCEGDPETVKLLRNSLVDFVRVKLATEAA